MFYALVLSILINGQPYGTVHLQDFGDVDQCNAANAAVVEALINRPRQFSMIRELDDMLLNDEAVDSYHLIVSCEPYREV